MRVEQRIGRIDRLGQTAEKIHVWNLFYEDTVDDRIYDRLFERLHVFEGALGGLETVLGEEIQGLTRDLFSKQLTPEEEEGRIEQTARALESRQLQEERLENEAAHLTAYGDYILHQVRAARELHRSISARDLRSYVTDFFSVHYIGSEFRQDARDPMRFHVSLPADARHDVAAYVRERGIETHTSLTRDTAHPLPCRFENTAVPDRQGRGEVISQFHPLVRFVSDRLAAPEQRRRPAVAIRLAPDALGGAFGLGRYAFTVQRWSVRGLRDMERLHYAAALIGGRRDPLEPAEAERLIISAVDCGTAWPGASSALDLSRVVQTVTNVCLAGSDAAFRRYVKDLEAENADRANVQERMLEEHHRTQRAMLEEPLARYRAQGRTRLLPATEGRLRALEAHVDHSHRRLAQALDDIDEKYTTECTNAVMEVLMALRRLRDPYAPNFESGLPIFMGGGGSRFVLVTEAMRRADARLRKAIVATGGIRPGRLPVLETLSNGDIPDDMVGRLDVAYGLSFDRLDIGEIVPPCRIEDVQARIERPRPEMVDKEQV